MKDIEEYSHIRVEFKKTFWLSMRKAFWKIGVSPNAFFGHMIKLIATGDPRVHVLMEEAKKEFQKPEDLSNLAKMDENSIYNLIEFELENKRKKIPEGKD